MDRAALAAIYNQGIEARTATFETALRSEESILEWFDGVHPVVVVTDDAGDVVVGVHERHARLDGQWKDIVVVEKFLAPLGEGSIPCFAGKPHDSNL